MSESSFNDIELDKLLKLLEQTEELEHNHPFIAFLRELKLTPGPVSIPVIDIMKMYDKKMSLKKAIVLCGYLLPVYYIRGEPHVNVNKRPKVKPRKTNYHTKLKFNNFLKLFSISPGETPVKKDTFYNFYDNYCYINRILNQLTKQEFIKECSKVFKTTNTNVYLNNLEGKTWRRRVKKEKA